MPCWSLSVNCCFYLVFFFFKQKTAYEMRISDWSSDVCSSDLVRQRPLLVLFHLDIKRANIDLDDHAILPDASVVAWSISFPKSSRPDQKVEYIFNTTKLRELFGEDDTDEDDRDDDD